MNEGANYYLINYYTRRLLLNEWRSELLFNELLYKEIIIKWMKERNIISKWINKCINK